MLLGSIAIPLARSFENRVHFVGNWGPLFAGILVMMGVFIPWDIWFTLRGVWSFNPLYVSGVYLSVLPLEEWLFFVVISYCIVFTYEVLRYFFPRFVFPANSLWMAVVLGLAFVLMGMLNAQRLYTLVVMSLTGILLLLQPLIASHKTWLTHFFLTWVVILLPFFVINGLLTSLPVVVYDNTQNLGIRLFTIPVEDAVYLMGMMLLVFVVYEALKKRRGFSQKTAAGH